MTIVEKLAQTADVASQYESYGRDTLTLKWEERRHGHGRRRSDSGVEFAISLPGGTILKEGDLWFLKRNERSSEFVKHPNRCTWYVPEAAGMGILRVPRR